MKSTFFTNDRNQRIVILLLAGIASYFLLGLWGNEAFAVTVAELQAPIQTLKESIFGGWMMAVKICAAAAGIILSVFRGSLAPFGIGAGLTLGIHLYDQYLGTGAAGALI